MHNTSRAFDIGMGGAQNPVIPPNGQSKTSPYGNLDSYRIGLDSSATLLSKQQNSLGANSMLMRDPSMTLQAQLQAGSQQSFHNPHVITHGHGPLPGQTAFGPSLSGPLQGVVNGAPGVGHLNNPGRETHQQQQPTEEISTIFVVGFPDDMTVRVRIELVTRLNANVTFTPFRYLIVRC